MKLQPLLIVGFGRFGKLAATLLRGDFHVSVLERKHVRLPRNVPRVTPRAIGDFPIVLLALPIHRLEGFLLRQGKRFAPGSFVADVCALKEMPMRWMRRYLPPSVSFTGLHPLFGPVSASDGVSGHQVVICRGRATPGCHKRLLQYLRRHGLKSVEADPITHDKIIASTLFLTQWVGHVLPPAIFTLRPPFENPGSKYLRQVALSAAGDRDHIIRDLCRYSPYPAKMLSLLSNRGADLIRNLPKKT